MGSLSTAGIVLDAGKTAMKRQTPCFPGASILEGKGGKTTKHKKRDEQANYSLFTLR